MFRLLRAAAAVFVLAGTSQAATTTTSLVVMSGGVAVTTVAQGKMVTLTATVMAGSTSVTPGQVEFCDASAAVCSDIHLLGTAQLTGAGTATYNFLATAGSHSYRAVFLGTTVNGASFSSTAALAVVGVAAPDSSSTVLTSRGFPGNYTLTATVTGNSTEVPTGSVSFQDETNGNYALATAPLGAGSTGLSIVNSSNPATPAEPQAIVVADFNGDGIPDMALTSVSQTSANLPGTLTIYLGKGDGTFTTAPSSPATGASPYYLAAGDFNSDGNVDLAITDLQSGAVTVLLGNGDGTFTAAPNASPGGNSGPVVAGDFNADGMEDLAVMVAQPPPSIESSLTVLLGNGDGTFRLGVSQAPGSMAAENNAIVAGDFNGDGKLDLAIANAPPGSGGFLPGSLDILLGNGDGTFTAAASPATGANPRSIGVADFNGDGNADLAVLNGLDGTVTVLLGDGKGDFAVAATPTVGPGPETLAIGDFNGDGKVDIIVQPPINTSTGYEQAIVLLGNGDGTFTNFPMDFPNGVDPLNMAVADFNSDGKSDFAIANSNVDTVSVYLMEWSGSASATVTGISPVGTGTHEVEAVYSGDGNYPVGNSNTVPLTAEPAATTLTLSAAPSSSTYGQPVTLTALLSPDSAQNHNATNSVTFYSNGNTLGAGAILNGVASWTGTSLPAGSDNLTAIYAGDNNFASSTSMGLPYAVAVSPADVPTVANVSPNTGPGPGGTNVTISGTNFSGVTAVNFGSTGATSFTVSSAASITAVSPAGTSTVDVTVTTGDGPSPVSASDQFTYVASSQSIAFPQPATPAYVGTSVLLSATGGPSGSPVVFSVASGPAMVSGSNGSTLTYTGPGTVVVEADQAAGAGYSAASVQVTITTAVLTAPVGNSSDPVPTLVTFQTAGSLDEIQSLTLGAQTLEFQVAPGGNCSASVAYTAGQTCVLNFVFTPTRPGQRFGGVVFSDASGTVLATSYLFGVGIGPQVTFSPGTQIAVPGMLAQPAGVAVDGSGDVFVADNAAGLYEIPPGGPAQLIGALASCQDVAVDGVGNVFVACSRTTLSEVLAVNGTIPPAPTIVTLSTQFNALNGIKVDGLGNVFLANGALAAGSGTVYKVVAVNGSIPSSPTVQTVTTAFSGPTGIAIDAGGNLFVSDQATSAAYELAAVNGSIPASPVIRSLGSGLSEPSNITLDAAGDVFVSDAGGSDVKEFVAVSGSVPANNPTILPLGEGLVSPQGVFVDPSGNVFVADAGLTQAVELDYADPPTLNFAPTIVGQTSKDSPQTVTLTNAGNAPLIFATPAGGLNPSISDGFTLGNTSTCPQLSGASTPATLLEGAACTDVVSFTPVTAGTISGTLVTTDNALNVPGATQTVLLNATGLNLLVPSVSLTATPNPVFLNNPVTLTATLSVTGPAPSGTVTFLDGTQPIGTATLNGTTASLSVSTLSLGTHSITAVYGGNASYTGASSPAVAVIVEDFTLTLVNPSVTIFHGGAATFMLLLTATNAAGMASTVNLAVSGEPDGSESTFTPASVAAGSNAVPVTLLIQTPNFPSGPWQSSARGGAGRGMALAALLLTGGLLLPWGTGRRRQRARLRRVCGALLMAIALTGLSGCGSGWRTQVWTINVTATAGQLSHSVTGTLTSECRDGQAACPVVGP